MPKFQITSPDGKTYQVDAPEGTTADQALAHVQAQHAADSGGGIFDPKGPLSSAVRSATNALTFNLADPAVAAIGAAVPVPGWTEPQNPDSNWASYGDRYHQLLSMSHGATQEGQQAHPVVSTLSAIAGGMANPVNRLLPLPSSLGGAMAQGAGLGAAYGAGGAISSQDTPEQAAGRVASNATLGAAVPLGFKIGGALTHAAGKTAAAALGMTTGAGGAAITQAYNAGQAGGDVGQAFLGAMRGDTPWTDAVDMAKGALANMRADRNAAYRSGMVDISGDKPVLDMSPISKAMEEASNIQRFKGEDLAKSAAQTRQALQQTVDHWAELDPTEYHTAEGMDALKQQIGDILQEAKPGTPSATMAGKVYNSVKDTIQEQAPTYAKVMSDYSDASDAVRNIQTELSLNLSPATALRKLQSALRDNANTSWGQRADYVGQLGNNGAPELMPALAGQALSSPLPRGLARYGDVVLELGLTALNSPAGLLALPAASPRAVGEGAYALGALSRNLKLADLLGANAGAVAQQAPSYMTPGMIAALAAAR